MATKEYSIKAPDGSIIKFRAPDDAPREKILAFAKSQYEKRAAAEVDGGSNAAPQKRKTRAGKTAYRRREEALAEIEKTNPFQAKALREMNPFEAALVGFGSGIKQLGAGVGLYDIPESERKILNQLTSVSDTAQLGEFAAKAAPFAAGGVAIGGAMRGASLGAKAGVQGALGAAEGNIIARGEGGDTEDIIAGTLVGGAIAPLAEVAGPAISKAARAIYRKVKGQPPIGRLIDDAGRPTKELQNVLDESGTTFDELVAEASQSPDVAESIVGAGRAENFKKAVGDVSAAIDEEALAASERLGLNAPVAVVSKDQATQELGGILSAIPGSRASEALNQFTEEFGRRADSFVEELGGSIDRGLIDQNLLVNMQSDINRIKALEDRLYERIRSDIGDSYEVNAQQLKNMIAARARNLGGKQGMAKGLKQLSKVEKDVYDRIQDGSLSYASLDNLISDVGAAIGRETDTYSGVKLSKLKSMYSDLSKIREGVAETFGHKTDIQRAKEIGASRFGLQESTQALFGKDLQTSIFPKIDRSVKGLERGNVREFRATMDLIPEKFRKPVAATMLNTALTGGRNQAIGINSTQFSRWFKNLERHETALNELQKYVGEDAVERLRDIAKVASGVSAVTGSRVRTGVTSEALKRLDDVDGIVGKIYDLAKKGQNIPVAGRAAAVIGNTAKTMAMSKTPAVEAAQDIMGSPKFIAAVKEAARAGTQTRRFNRLNSQLKNSKEYKKYIRSLDDQQASRIASAGLISWLASDEE